MQSSNLGKLSEGRFNGGRLNGGNVELKDVDGNVKLLEQSNMQNDKCHQLISDFD